MYNEKRHLALSEHVLAVLMCHAESYWEFLKHNITREYFLSSACRDLFDAVGHLRTHQQPIHVATLPQQYEKYASQLITLYETMPSIKNAFSANCSELKNQGQIAIDVAKLMQAVSDLQNGKNERQKTTADLVSHLTLTRSGGLTGETAEAGANAFIDMVLNDKEERVLSWGNTTLDNTFPEGILIGKFVGLAAPDKGRKTSIMLNWFIHLVRNGFSSSIFMLEDTRENITAKIIAMLAVQRIFDHGYSHLVTPTNKPIHHISSDWLIKNKKRYSNRSDAETIFKDRQHPHWAYAVRTLAIWQAIDEFKSWGTMARIYDKTEEGGALSDTDSIINISLRDKALYGCEVSFVDHLQTIDEKGSDYEKQLLIVDKIESFVRTQQITFVMLAQLNKDAGEGTNFSSHSMGVAGGNKFQAKIDMGFTLFVEQEDIPENSVRIKRHRSRSTRQGDFTEIELHPHSGMWF